MFFSDSAEYKHVEIGDWYKVGEIAPDDTEGYPGSTSLPLVPYSTWFNTTNGYQTTFGAVEGQAGFTYGYEHEFLDPTIVAGLPPNQFISGTLHDCIPIPGGGWSMKVFSNNDLTTPKFYPMAFKVIDVNTMFATVELLVPNSTLSLTDLISGADNTYSFGAFPNASLTPQSKPPIDPSEKSIFTMAKYSLQQSPGIPQTGQKIPCDNWTLSIVPVGIRDPYKLNATRFVQLRPGEIMRSIFLKCKFGFIPDAE